MMTHVFHAARARSLFCDRFVWVVIRRGKWVNRLVVIHGDKMMTAFRSGVRMF